MNTSRICGRPGCGQPLKKNAKRFCGYACALAARTLPSPERVALEARIAELWATGIAAAAIGRRLGITKNTVLGIAWRGGLPPRGPAWQMPPATPDLFPPRGRCVYPFGDPDAADFRFCGRRASLGDPYCAEHHARCYRRAVPRDLSALTGKMAAE